MLLIILDVWLEYMNFAIEHAKLDPEASSVIHWRAMKTLKPELVKDFQIRVTQYYTGGGTSSTVE